MAQGKAAKGAGMSDQQFVDFAAQTHMIEAHLKAMKWVPLGTAVLVLLQAQISSSAQGDSAEGGAPGSWRVCNTEG
jgi:hypothetical protein